PRAPAVAVCVSRGGPPVPSTTVPPTITRSWGIGHLPDGHVRQPDGPDLERHGQSTSASARPSSGRSTSGSPASVWGRYRSTTPTAVSVRAAPSQHARWIPLTNAVLAP